MKANERITAVNKAYVQREKARLDEIQSINRERVAVLNKLDDALAVGDKETYTKALDALHYGDNRLAYMAAHKEGPMISADEAKALAAEVDAEYEQPRKKLLAKIREQLDAALQTSAQLEQLDTEHGELIEQLRTVSFGCGYTVAGGIPIMTQTVKAAVMDALDKAEHESGISDPEHSSTWYLSMIL